MRENEFTAFTKVGVWVLVALAFLAAIWNIVHGAVRNPGAFWIVLAGFVLFAVGKVSVIAKGRWISFGAGVMSANMANMYRLGYWLMAVGILVTFA
jgi:hypothetical protein